MFNILSMFVGVLIGFMTISNSLLSTYMGNYSSSVIIHLAGLVGVTLVMIFTKSKLTFKNSLPLTLYTAGIIGVFTVLFNNLTVAFIGASLTTALGLLGQTISSIIIDHYGLLGTNVCKFNQKKLIGLSIIIIGLIIMTIY